MPRLDLVRLAVVGLALAAPTAAWAGLPVQPKPGRARHLCPHCQMKAMMKAEGLKTPPPTTVRVESTVGRGEVAHNCAACLMTAPGSPATSWAGGEAPGYAAVGMGADGMVVSAEPAPIGVVQAGFRPGPGGAMMPPDVMAGMRPWPAAGMTVPPPPTPYLPQRSTRRPSVFAHLLGLPQRGTWGQARRERERSEHAALRYGSGAQPASELPAAMVYGR